MSRFSLQRWWLAVALAASIGACSKLDLGGGSGPLPTPTPSGTPTTGPTPGACGTPDADASTVFVPMGNVIGPVSMPRYGTIDGCSVVEQGQFSRQAMLINQWMNQVGTVGPITTANVVQVVKRRRHRHAALGRRI